VTASESTWSNPKGEVLTTVVTGRVWAAQCAQPFPGSKKPEYPPLGVQPLEHPRPVPRPSVDSRACRRPFVWNGIDVGGKMGVVKLTDGSLWVHSPVSLDAELTAALAQVR
jgi:hypothetical protein